MMLFPILSALNNDLTVLTDSGAIKGLDAREDGVYITYVPSAGADPVVKKLGSLSDVYVRAKGLSVNGGEMQRVSAEYSLDGIKWITAGTISYSAGQAPSGKWTNPYKIEG